MKGLFDGIRVLSLAEQFPGPYATLLMADLGADVILVERPGIGDPARAFPAFFRSLARNKRSVCLDLKAAPDRDAFLALVDTADVVMEGYRPGTMEKLGLGYDVLKARNPRLVHVSITGFGQTGPARMRPAHDLSYQGVAGMIRQTKGGEPALPDLAIGDLSSGTFAAFATASALFARERTGQGTTIDVSMTDGLVSWMTPYLVPHVAGDSPFDVHDEPAYGAFRCADGTYLTLSIAHEDHFWAGLCRALGSEDLASLTGAQRRARSPELRHLIANRIARHDRSHWSTLFDRDGIAWSPLYDLDGVAADPHFVARGLFRDVATKTGSERHVAQPVRFSAYATEIRRPAPALGEHGDEVLGRIRKGRVADR
ncbi:CoA transferase [Nitratireductor mangrovi]|uniref:CoA transferase n=1 Tax=Nitratireductor mangrovi TaxID=2599600 RepID=A0A5B8KYC8_9HYPH|nr:CaiB/BaiF CoA-transferase family protein [Nitratireductor mangrovi]QDZ00561.1 CoA transferase [Nitratireductor mangrovi]